MRITSGGFIGIGGITSPTATLCIGNVATYSSDAAAAAGGLAAGAIYKDSAGGLHIKL